MATFTRKTEIIFVDVEKTHKRAVGLLLPEMPLAHNAFSLPQNNGTVFYVRIIPPWVGRLNAS